jgi:hypothetical protein|tara:strand:- start:191 stop:412 length:222 start_codon:yes stop_codon:yes gene_type:complete
LLTLTESDILSYFKDLENESKNIKHELLKICWYMRGGVTWQESLNLSVEERKIIADIIKENLETAKKTGQPFF